MRIKSLLYFIDRALWHRIVSVGRLRLTGYFEMVDGTWKRHDLTLYNLEDFLGCRDDMQPTLDKQTLHAVHTRLKQDCKFRKDCFQLQLRGPSERECETNTEEFFWPDGEKSRKQLLSSVRWETNFTDSKYATIKPYFWMSEAFLVSIVQFPLSNHPVYAQIACVLQQSSCINFIWINQFDGKGMVTQVKREQSVPTKKRKTIQEEEEQQQDVTPKTTTEETETLQEYVRQPKKSQLKRVYSSFFE